jgi:hypothetical protein
MEQMSDPPEYFVEMLNHQRKKKIVSQLVSDVFVRLSLGDIKSSEKA